jgi:hypothetical protein
MDKLKQVIEQIKEYEDNNCFELKTSVVLHWLNEIQNEAINYTHCCEELCDVCNNNQVFETEDGYTADCPRCNEF